MAENAVSRPATANPARTTTQTATPSLDSYLAKAPQDLTPGWSANLKLSRNGLVGSDEPHCQRLCQVKSLSPYHRFVIALPSPIKVTERGLRMCRPEKGQQIDAIRSRAVRSLQSALRTKYCGIRACFAYFAAKGGAVSLQFRLAGGEIEIRTFVTFCVGPLRADVCATYNGFCKIHVSSGEFLQHSNREKQSRFLFGRMANT